MALTDFMTALDRAQEIELGTVGRVSGRQTSRPVWFVRRDKTLYLLPIHGAASDWYRNVLHTSLLSLNADGAAYAAPGSAITDPDGVARVADYFREKYGAGDIAAHYQPPEVAVEVPL
jgi:hypothetical protein